ncbi:MAG: PucR family transcriptional regulator ligand-binding domain-containing protein [Sporomusaceae bacterium]|nr:PucR family transcriptional regulator ligand-binding domain-containing protein [Sporomusaceae bacterium]
MLSIAELLNIPPFSQMTVLNPGADLSRRVDSADISETPDIAGFIKPHTLLITTGMAFKTDPAGFCRMLEEVDRLPIAGICIKLGRFIDTLPPAVIAAADKRQLPLLQIPGSWTLGVACHQLLSYLWNVENEQLLNALKIQREYSRMLIKDASVSLLLTHLSRTVRQAACLLDPFGEITTTSLPGGKLTPRMEQALAALRQSGIRGRAADSIPASFYVNGPRPFTAWIFPVWAASSYPHLLIVVEEGKIPYPFSYLIIEQTAVAIAFSLYKNQKLRELARTMREDFLLRLSRAASCSDPAALLEQGSAWGLTASDYYRCLIIGIDDLPAPQPAQAEMYGFVCDWLERHAAALWPQAVVFARQHTQTLIILLQQPAEQLAADIARCRQQIAAALAVSISCAAGNPVSSLPALAFSLLEAEEIYQQCRSEGKTAFFQTYYAKRVSELLRFIPPEHARHFCSCMLKALAYPQQETQVVLRRTLQAYLSCQGDIAATARTLFIHRNTVKYRIARLNELLDAPLSNPEFSLQLRLALLLSEPQQQDRDMQN